MNYTETLEYIHSLGNFSKPAGLERISLLLERLGNPQNGFPAIHIAGTNGKGSVCAMCAEVFKEAGFKTGLYISPYIIDFRERIQVNGNFISEEDIVRYAECVKSADIAVTEFEFITALAFLYFNNVGCDIVIVETGLGGRLDATNTLARVKAAVITKIGLDHTAVLGGTLKKIAAEKCGIIKNFTAVTTPYQPHGALSVIEKTADRLYIPDISQLKILSSDENGNTFIYKNIEYHTSLGGDYQIENALTVIETVNASGYNIGCETVKKAISQTFFPARMEFISTNPVVLLDGAHNPDAAAALSRFLKRYSGKATAIIGVMADKDYNEVLNRTLIYCKAAVAVTVENLPRSLPASDLCAAARQFCDTVTAESYDDAIKTADKLSGKDPIVVFGSLYLAAGIRCKLKEFYKNLI